MRGSVSIFAEQFSARLADHARTNGAQPAFSEISGRSVSYSRLINFVKDGPAITGDSSLTCILLDRGVTKAVMVAALCARGTPGFCLESHFPDSFVLSQVEKFRPKFLCTTPARWHLLAAHFPNALVSNLNLFGEELAIIDTGHPATTFRDSWMLLTSGSTGDRKGVMIGSSALLARVEEEVADFEIRTGDVLINVLSFAHDLGLNQLLTSLWAGAELRLRRPPFARDLARIFALESFDGVTGTPLVWQRLLESGLTVSSRPRFVTVSGGHLSAANLLSLRPTLPHTTIICTYGQTETFRSLISVFKPHEVPVPLFRRAVNGVNIRLTTEGELLHSGPANMSGYFGEDSAPTEIRTGDFFVEKAEGSFQMTGRRDFLVKRNDHRVSLIEIENALKEHPKLEAASVLTDNAGKIVAVVVPKPGFQLNENEIPFYMAGRMPYFMVPDKMIVRASLPLTGAYKIDRAALRMELQI